LVSELLKATQFELIVGIGAINFKDPAESIAIMFVDY